MRTITFVVTIAAIGLFGCPRTEAASDQGGNNPIFVSGTRVVDLRNTSGHLARYTTIPTASEFSKHGGSGSSCSFTASGSGTTSDGQRYSLNQRVYSRRWIFVESFIVTGDSYSPHQSRGPLRTAYRTFNVYCDSQAHFLGYLMVYSTDPMINPRSQLTRMYNGLQLEQPTVWRNPVVAKWGGLITRYPAWLAINAGAWRPQTSNSSSWRGWRMYLLSTPVALDFHVVFTPDPARPSTPFDGFVPCVGRNSPVTAGNGAVPAFTGVPDLANPGINWFCMWTPPGPGTVRIEARITYRVTFWANAYTEQLADYVWNSPTAVYSVGELSSVNTNE